MSNLQTHYHFKLDFQKVDQHTEGTWLTPGIKRLNDSQLQSLEGVRRRHVQSNIQGECPMAETSRELCICRIRST